MIDYEKALLDPTSCFKHPEDVLNDDNLDSVQKKKILERWAYDAKELEIADEENMSGKVSRDVTLAQVLHVLNQLQNG